MSEFITQEVHHWRTVRLDREPADLEPDELPYAVNADLFLENGVIRTRRGSSPLTTAALADLTIRRLARVNSIRYQVGGTALYRNGTAIQSGLHSSLVTTIQPSRPLNDATTWAFVADASGMKKDNGSALRNWGLATPTTAPTLGITGGTLTGTYGAVYTYARKSGDSVVHESNPSPAGTAQALTSQGLRILVPSATDAQVTHIRVYRTVAGGASYFFDQELGNTITSVTYAFTAAGDIPVSISGTYVKITEDTTVAADYQVLHAWEKDHLEGTTLGASTAYTVCFPWEATEVSLTYTWQLLAAVSTQADSALGAEAEEDNDPPPACGWVSPADDGRLWLTQDPAFPHYVYWSKRFRPEAFPTENYLEVTTPEDPAQAVLPFGGIRIAFCLARKYRILGTGTAPFVVQETPSKRGTISWATVAAGEDGVYFLARDGIFRTNGFSPDDQLAAGILRLFKGESVNGYLPINWDQAAKFCLAIFERVLYVSWADTAHTDPNIVWAHRIGTEDWEAYEYPTGLSALHQEDETGYLTAGGQDGHVHRLETGSDDNGTAITMTVDSKDHGHVLPDSPTGTMARHLFRFMREDVSGGTFSTQFLVDGTSKHTAAIATSRKPAPVALPATAQGYRWKKRWTFTGTTVGRIFGTSVQALPLEMAQNG